MARISTYEIDLYPHLDDILIGTDRNDRSITKNYLVSDILALGQTNYTLQAVTEYGNTSTLPISVLGTNVQYIDFGVTDISIQPKRLRWNQDEGTVEIGMGYDNVVGQVLLEQFYHIKNQSGTTINDGAVVMFDGAVGASGKLKGKVADQSANTFPRALMGVATMDISNGFDGFVTQFGVVRGINTSQWESGDILWWNPAVPGGMTNVMPEAPNAKVVIAAVINKHSQQGSIFVRPSYGLKLGELHDVKSYDPNIINNGSILAFNKANARWEVFDYSELFIHNNLGGLNSGDYVHMTSSQAVYLSTLTTITNGYIPIKSSETYVNSPIQYNESVLSFGNNSSPINSKLYGSLEITKDLKDSSGSSGTVGQVFTSLGAGAGTRWKNPDDKLSYILNGVLPGVTPLVNFPLSSGYGAYVDYVILSPDNSPYRIGTFYVTWNSTEIEYMNYGTQNIGMSNDVVVMRASNNGVNISILSDISAGTYNIKLQIRFI